MHKGETSQKKASYLYYTFREHRRKTFVTRSRFCGLSEFVKKGKSFFSDNIELSSKNLWKMISADVKS